MLQWVQQHVTVVGACCRRRRFVVEEAGDGAGARGNGGARAERDRVAGGSECSGSDSKGRSWLGARQSCRALPKKTTVATELESGAEALNMHLTS